MTKGVSSKPADGTAVVGATLTGTVAGPAPASAGRSFP